MSTASIGGCASGRSPRDRRASATQIQQHNPVELLKAYLRLLVDEIKLDGNELIVRGSHRRLADAIGFMQRKKLGEVPRFVNDWRAGRDSN